MCSSLSPALPVFEVSIPGLETTVQDSGRHGYRAVGVPESGAQDRFALQAANLLLGNDAAAAALEVLLAGLSLRIVAPTTIALTGADLGATLDEQPLSPWASYSVVPGQELVFTGRRSGARAYLGVCGGLAVEVVLGSRSTYLPGGWGGYKGRALRAGDLVAAFAAETAEPAWLPPDVLPPYGCNPVLRYVAGPHVDLFQADAPEMLHTSPYTVSSVSNRMGYRLEGLQLTAAAAALPSLGVLPGVIQVTPGGQPILLMADAQTTGGYPVIGTVIQADLPLAAQLLPGDRLTFRRVDIGTARRALLDRDRTLRSWRDGDVGGTPI